VISGYGYSLEKTFVPKRVAHYRQSGVAGRSDHVIEGFGGQARGEPFARYVADMTAERDGWTDVEDIVTIFEACARPEPASVYQGVTSPSLIVTGSEDSAHRSSLALHERLAGSELAKMEGAGHLCQLERPWEWDSIVLDFLRRHRLLPAAMKENGNGRG
jgi:pimeloyl-ACP methyl ester carboxylesterase